MSAVMARRLLQRSAVARQTQPDCLIWLNAAGAAGSMMRHYSKRPWGRVNALINGLAGGLGVALR